MSNKEKIKKIEELGKLSIGGSTKESVEKPTVALAKPKKAPKNSQYLEIDYDDLELYERIGRGAYGSVYHGLWKSRNKVVAIKKLLQLENEADVLSTCSHRNIIQFYGVVCTSSNYCIITEYAEYGSLHQFIGQHDIYEEFGLGLLLKWAHEISLGMNYLHSEAPMKIIHRDLKSNNVLITTDGDEMICKICDFGSSKFGIQTTKMTITGTFPWMSPELIQSKPANQSTDVWSYGVVLWELITGEVPFKGIEEFQIAFLVVEREHRLPIPQGCPSVLSSLMQLCWQTDSRSRPTFKQILTKLDQIDLDANVIDEIDKDFSNNKARWELEIKQAFEKLNKIQDDLNIKEKLLEAREKRLREMELELISSSSKCITDKEHDVNSWREHDVFQWVTKIEEKHKHKGGSHADLFLNHNINGKRLLMMKKNDLRNIGITSEGHIIDLHYEINCLKVENTRLLNFPPLKQEEVPHDQLSQRSVSYNLLIGAHIMNPSNLQESKWKAFIDVDESNETPNFNVLSCIHDVKFALRSKFEQFSVHRPPFIMKHWQKGISDDSKITCTITYETKVINPKKTVIDFQLSTKCTISQTVTLTLEETLRDILNDKFNNTTNTTADFTLSNLSTDHHQVSSFKTAVQPTAVTLVGSNLQFSHIINSSSPTLATSKTNVFFNNAWSKKTLENIVSIPEPENTQKKNSSDLWAGIVVGKYKINDAPPVVNKIATTPPVPTQPVPLAAKSGMRSGSFNQTSRQNSNSNRTNRNTNHRVNRMSEGDVQGQNGYKKAVASRNQDSNRQVSEQVGRASNQSISSNARNGGSIKNRPTSNAGSINEDMGGSGDSFYSGLNSKNNSGANSRKNSVCSNESYSYGARNHLTKNVS